MKIGIGISGDLGLDPVERTVLITEAAALGYTSAWTNARGTEGIDTCEQWFAACGIAVGTNVIPTPGVDRAALAARARALGARSNGSFTLGIGAGGIASAAYRTTHGIPAEATPVGVMRQHLDELRPAAGVPVYLAAMGPVMLRLAGGHFDGVLPNWMDPPHIAWARARIAEGARAAGRDPAGIEVAQYVRVAVDEDEHAARTALATAAFGYALGRPGQAVPGSYRIHMTRMGLDADLTRLEALRAKGMSDQELADACPEAVLDRLGAYGRPARALAALRRLSEGLDLTIIRVVGARPGIASARAVVIACAPPLWT